MVAAKASGEVGRALIASLQVGISTLLALLSLSSMLPQHGTNGLPFARFEHGGYLVGRQAKLRRAKHVERWNAKSLPSFVLLHLGDQSPQRRRIALKLFTLQLCLANNPQRPRP
jgi:hypothetical protein